MVNANMKMRLLWVHARFIRSACERGLYVGYTESFKKMKNLTLFFQQYKATLAPHWHLASGRLHVSHSYLFSSRDPAYVCQKTLMLCQVMLRLPVSVFMTFNWFHAWFSNCFANHCCLICFRHHLVLFHLKKI